MNTAPNLSVVRSPEEIKRDEEAISALLALFDALAAYPHDTLTTIWVHHTPAAEYAFRLWCSTKRELAFEERDTHLTALRKDFTRVVTIRLDDPRTTAACDPRVTIDREQMWSPPTDGAA